MAAKDQHELSQDAQDRITRVVRSLAEDRVERGVELGKPMHCDSCGQEKHAAGAALYGAYKLCNDCLLDFTLALAGNQVDNIADYMTRRVDGVDPLALDANSRRDEAQASRTAIHVRDKLMPSNEPC